MDINEQIYQGKEIAMKIVELMNNYYDDNRVNIDANKSDFFTTVMVNTTINILLSIADHYNIPKESIKEMCDEFFANAWQYVLSNTDINKNEH